MIDVAQVDQMYIHHVKLFGTAGGYLSMAPYPHRQFTIGNQDTSLGQQNGSICNSYKNDNNVLNVFRKGALTQAYKFGLMGSTRPELEWTWPKVEVLNNPFTLVGINFPNYTNNLGANPIDYSNLCKILTVQSTNTGGDALWICQVNVTVRDSEFIEIAAQFGGASFGEENVASDNYIPPLDGIQRKEDGEKAHQLANKKRKIKNVKDLTLPTLDGK